MLARGNEIIRHGVLTSGLVIGFCFSAVAQEKTIEQIQPVTSQTQTVEPVTPEPALLSKLSQQIKTMTEKRLADAKTKSTRHRIERIIAHYEAHLWKPIWIENGKPTSKAKLALAVLGSANDHGLKPDEYSGQALLDNLDGADLTVKLEVGLTDAVINYAQHVNAGRVDPLAVNREIIVRPKRIKADVILNKVRITSNIQVYLRLLAPHTPRYERLKLALEDYRRTAKNGGWSQIDKGEVLKPDMEDARVVQLRKRLIEDGTLDLKLAEGEKLDEDVVAALKKFQARHGLAEDGVVGPQTLAELNTTANERVNTIVLNMERRRWMQNEYGRYYVFANLADQAIKLVRDEKTLHWERIQVGKPYHRTPVFNDEMEYIELNPFWNVPYSIATKEYLPKLKKGSSILSRQNIKVLAGGKIVSASSIPWNSYSRKHFPVRLRQNSGKKNALGRVKFMFPNKHNVYIHDTPSKANFNKSSRYFSHGCMRLRDPLTMAERILGVQGWSRKKIDGVVSSGKRTVVKLKEKIPVHVTYLTAWVNKNGSVHFRKDVYGRDKILAKAMGISI